MRVHLPASLAAWVALACLTAAAVAQGPTPSGPTPLNVTGRPLRLCTLERPPMAFCEPGGNSSEALGITVDLFRAAAAEVGWVEDVDFAFDCVPLRSQDVIVDLASDTGTCDAGIAALVMSSERADAGVQFTWPYYTDYLSALVSAETVASTGWAWAKPFTLDLWLSIVATMIVWPALIFILEAYALRGRVKPRHVVAGLEESVWRSLWALFFGETIQLATLGAKVAAGCFAFLSLILSAAYTANLAAFLTLRNGGTIGAIEDLKGAAVASVQFFAARLRSEYGVIASDANITDTASILAAGNLVEQGKLKAFVFYQTVLQWAVTQYPDCKLTVVGAALPYYYAIPFAKGMDPGLVGDFSDAVLRLMETGLMRQLEDKYINKANACFDPSSLSKSTQIDFLSLWGLWVIVAAGLGLGAGITLANRWHRQHSKRRMETMRTANTSAARKAAMPGLVDIIFTPQLSLRAPKESDFQGPTSDLVELSDDEDDTSSDEEDE